MKRLVLLLVALLGAATGRSQSISAAQLAGPDRAVHDAEYGVAFTLPPGWELDHGNRWGELEATLFLQTTAVAEAKPAAYYRAYYEPLAPAEGFAAWLKNEAESKARMRVRDEFTDYANRADSYVARTINGHAALSWVADFTSGGRKWRELLTQVAAPTGRILFFVRVPADKLTELEPGYQALVLSTRLTAGNAVQNVNPRLLEGRKLYQAKEYAQAVAAFTAAFKTEPVRGSDLVTAAGAAALAGEKDLAMQWLNQAWNKGGVVVGRVKSNPDFAPLHDTDAWKQFSARLDAAMQPAKAPTDEAMHAKLVAIQEEDQKYRRQLDTVEKKFGRDSPEIKDLWKTIATKDAENLVEVKKILDERGWLGPDAVGQDGNMTLFLVIQHSDHATQLKYLPMMREAVKAGKARGSSLALLEDRVALGEGKPQIYGSQIGRDPKTGKYRVQKLEDPDHVDERRASVGLPPLAEYVKRWEITWDVEAFKQQQAEQKP